MTSTTFTGLVTTTVPVPKIARVSTWVIVVVIREVFSLVTSAICVWIRGHRSEVMRIVYHMAQFSSTAAFLPQWIRRGISTLFCYVNIKLIHLFVN